MEEVVILRTVDGDEISYEIHDEYGEYISDHGTLEEAVQEGLELAQVHGLKFIKIAVDSEVI